MSIEKSLLALIATEGKKPLSDQEIAEELHVTREYISTIRKKLKIESSKKRLEPILYEELKKLLNENPSYTVRQTTSILNDRGFNVSMSFVHSIIKKQMENTDEPLSKVKSRNDVQTIPIKAQPDLNVEVKYDPFTKMIGASGSLKSQILLAKAAVLYPPIGLHTIIIGDSGVGKSFLAKLMYEYAVAEGAKKDKFIVFNCADYAENVQLLYSHLFGHVKGAFTGANSDKEGLISLANDGIIFLDEIHRLPPEGQEMLFNVIDNGKYRKLGQSNSENDVKVMVIAATTENIESELLGTFRRRIPMVIELPPLKARPTNEKIEFIELIVTRESKRIGNYISMSHVAFSALKKYNPVYNFGLLESELKVAIAKAYLLFSIGENNEVEITLDMLSPHIRDVWFNSSNDDSNEFVTSKFVVSRNELMVSKDFSSTDIYQFINEKKDELEHRGYSMNEINSLLQTFIVEKISYHVKDSDLIRDKSIEMNNLVDTDLLEIINEFIIYAQQKIPELIFNSNLKIALGYHIAIAIERIKNNQPIIHPSLEQVQEENKVFFDLALYLISKLENKFSISMPKDEAGYICMYLNLSIKRDSKNNDIGLLIACHGKVASTMLEVAKYFIKDSNVYAIDMDLDVSPSKIYKIIKSKIKEMDCKNGILLLTDMGSLSEMWKNLRNELNVNIESISRVDTVMLMNAMYWRNFCLNSRELKNKIDFKHANIQDEIKHNEKQSIIIYCITGEGSSRHIAYHLKKQIPELEEKYNIEYMGLMYEDTISKIRNLSMQNNIKILIGNVPINELDFQCYLYMSCSELTNIEGVEKLKMILGLTEKSELHSLFSMNHIYAKMNFSSREEVLDFICDKFVVDGIVTSDFKDAVYRRESWTNTYIGSSIALPHTMEFDSINISQVSIITLEKEIDWAGFPVQVICLFAIKNSGDKYFKKIYEKITNNLSTLLSTNLNSKCNVSLCQDTKSNFLR